MKYDNVLLAHGGGGLLTGQLIAEKFLPLFSNPYLEKMEDGAVFNIGDQKFCFTTDSYVVNPIFFPGGDIGALAVNGTVNDLAMCGGRPLFLSAGFILEEGFPMAHLETIIASMSEAAKRAGVAIVTGDTKVVPRGAADGIFINTAGVGVINYIGNISVKAIEPGDVVILNGTMGDHGATILNQRQALRFDMNITSDTAPLGGLVEVILDASAHIHAMRDATRGGLGAVIAEMAVQSQTIIEIDEARIPVHDEVRGFCEVLGIDPLFLANEGKMVVFCSEADALEVLAAMKSHEYGKDAAIIGTVKERDRGRFVLKTIIGGLREIDLPSGELVPRIC